MDKHMKTFHRGRQATLAAILLLTAGIAPAAEKVTYYHLDALGSPVAASDAAGNVVWRESYQPYGERIQNAPAAADNARWYTGHPQDPDTGLVYAGARYYDPVIGRFMAVDPVSFTEKNLHSFNRYAYANNNPYKYIDPNGQESYLVSRPLGGNSKLFSHNFVVTNAKYVGDPKAIVYSYGENGQGNTGRVDERTKGFSEGTHKADREFWNGLSDNADLGKESASRIDAPDAAVDKKAESLVEDTDYAAVGATIGTGTNSNSAASAVANTAQRSKVAIPGGARMAPGSGASSKIRFEK